MLIFPLARVPAGRMAHAYGLRLHRCQRAKEIVMKVLEAPCNNCCTHAAAQVKVVVQVVDGHQYACAYFSCHEQVAQVRA